MKERSERAASESSPNEYAEFAEAVSPVGRWDIETDVLIAGCGGAGAFAAIAAHDAGSDVLVLEKMPVCGGNTAISGGGFIIPKNASHAFEYLRHTFDGAESEMDAALIEVFCEEAAKTREYLEKLEPGIELGVWGYANFPGYPHADTIVKYAVRGEKTGGMNLFGKLESWLSSRGIRVMTECPVLRLLHEGGEVRGAAALCGGKEIRVRARQAVILACGGYEYDKGLLRKYCIDAPVGGLGNPGNTGDGLKMAAALGAGLWHMGSYSSPLGIAVPGKKASVPVHLMTPGYVWVDQNGRRFCNEAGLDFHSHFYAVNKKDPKTGAYPAIPCYLVMDEAGRKAGPVTHAKFGYVSVAEGYRWSEGCEEEIKAGIVKKAETPEALAALIGVPPENLAGTVRRWNETVSRGEDPDFGRKMEKPPKEKDAMVGVTAKKLSAPLLTPPYYAVELFPALLNTQGGPKRNVKSQVVRTDGTPVPRLYAAGELGSVWGTRYQGSSNIAEAMVFGRIAGREAASEPRI